MTISTYISTIDSLFFQTTLEQTIRQSLLFSDEIIVVNSEHSLDGTQNLLNDLKSEYPNIIKLYSFKEDYSKHWDTVAEKKTFALKQCTMDWCILQDDDEMIHEKYAEFIKQLPLTYSETIGFRFNVIHFYRSFNHYQIGPNWYKKKLYMIKNPNKYSEIEIKHGRVVDDPDNHVIFNKNQNRYVPLDSLPYPKVEDTTVTSYHYGWCRQDCILQFKKYVQEIQWWGRDYWNTDNHRFPQKFDNPNSLPTFEETHPKFMLSIIEKEKRYNSRFINSNIEELARR